MNFKISQCALFFFILLFQVLAYSKCEDNNTLCLAYQNGCKSFEKMSDRELHREKTTRAHLAAACGNQKALNFLEEKHNLDAKDKNDATPLHVAAIFNKLESAQVLIKNRADLNAIDNTKFTPLHFAASSKESFPIMEALTEAGADVNAKSSHLLTPLHISAMINHPEGIRQLIKKNADSNATDIKGRTPLHFVVKPITTNMRTMLDLLALGDSAESAEFLIRHGHAKVNVKTKENISPLHVAITYSNGLAVATLVNWNADVNATSAMGFTPLIMACILENQDLSLSFVKSLLKYNANINATNDAGDTALHFAVTQNNVPVIEYLIQNNAKLNIKNKNSESPLDLARKIGNKKIIKLFENNNLAVTYK